MAPPSSSSSTPTSSGSTTSVQVAVRIRPTTSQDAVSIPARFQRIVVHSTSHTSVAIDASSAAPATSGSSTAVATPTTPNAKKQVFSFDQVHSPDTTQHALFTSTALPLISRFLEGFNCTVLAYGQTSSGKTFTMTGVDLDASPSDPHNGMGIIPRAVSTIFAQARKLKEERGASWNYTIKGSFIEIYNEDLIDLLSSDDTGGLRREVQIREAKDGSIIWGGLREVTVRSNAEVMNLIRQGTSIRRTNETDMNAQSSRSHAIFSLTLTQKKYTGSGPPPRSSSPLPPGRSPSRLARPGSLHTNGSPSAARVSSPIPGRPSTPSFHTAIGRGGGLRPASSLGLRPSDGRADVADDDAGGWTTIVSKFHFVDLAGSERLKRTSAAGDRIKEGISINSGLLALGNVISALGDPSRSKSHTNSHVPYRDSKLTRLLQDSLGGNAHTMMIACVSPTEWNVGETVNTLKYANRARNIKNRVTVNEKEDGWDDIEWLQGTVTRLRKELKQLKDGGAIVPPGSHELGSHISESTESPNKRVLQQMSELQNNYEDLREKYVERTEELARLRRELGERHRRSSGGSVGGTAKYEEIVGPVIEEYEKTISAMEAELGLNRAALRLTNEMVEEKEEELAQLTERHVATELYVEELRTRLAKLGEREASTEAYVRDLEEKMKSYDETSVSSSESLSDLKREVARYKEAEAHSTTYIVELEARLTRADESILSLQQSVEHLESEGERRREEVEMLQTRLENFENDGENWRTDLEEREKKVRELELKMEEWKQKRKEAGEDRARLGSVIGEVEQAKRSLEDLTTTKNGISNPPSGVQTPTKIDLSVETQLAALQQTHAATLTDLASVSAKYRDALQEIADLAAQIQEAKLSNPTIPESPVENVEIPTFKRKMTASRSREALGDAAQLDASGKRHFFRQAASSDSLHAKSLSQSLSPSVSLSQELSLARSRKISSSSHGTSSPISQSPSIHHSNLSISLSSPNGGSTPTEHRSIISMEREIMRLQDVLKEREAEISALEMSLKEKEQTPTITPPVATVSDGVVDPSTHLSPTTAQKFEAICKSMALHGVSSPPNGASPDTEVDESLDRLNELMLSMAQKESQHQELVDSLSQQLTQVRRAHDELVILSRDQTLNMSTELEGLRLKHDNTLEELENLRQREHDLLQSIKRAEIDHAAAMEMLRSDHQHALDARSKEVDERVACLKDEHEASLGSVRNQLEEANTALEKAIREHEEKLGKLRAEHESELQLSLQEASSTLQRLEAEHQAALAELSAGHEVAMKSREEAAAADLHRTEEEYYNALTKLRNDHAEVLQKQADEAAAILERLKEDHASEMRMVEKARECSLSESESVRDQALRELQEEHASAIARKETLYVEDIERLKAEHARILSGKEEDYRSRREHMKMEHTTSLAVLREQSEAQIESLTKAFQQQEQEAAASATRAREEHELTIQALQRTHAAALEELARSHDDEVAQINASQEKVLQATLTKAEEEQKSLTGSHSDAIAKLQAEHEAALLAVHCTLKEAQEKHRTVFEEFQVTAERQLAEERNRSAAALAELERRHSALRDEFDEERAALRKELDATRADVKNAEDRHKQELETERRRSALALEQLQTAHSGERETLLKDAESFKNELESRQAIVKELEQARREHERAVSEKTELVATMEEELTSVRLEKDRFKDEMEKLKADLAEIQTEQAKLAQETSKRQSLTDELEKHRSLIAEMQESLQRVRDEKDTLQAEKTRQENALRDLQAQIARSSTSTMQDAQSSRATPDRNLSFTRINSLNGKLPPPTPPPSVPPPPAPRPQDSNFSVSTPISVISPSSSRDSQSTESPATSVLSISLPGVPPLDTKAVAAKIEDQARQISEQEAMIKTLNKQLSHCESDLATHMDLVTTLETSLSESEKNLRKARMQATELVRERDSLNSQIEGLRNELQDARREVATVRKSIAEEKQSMESKLEEERRAKERARAQLDSRMDEIQRRKSKFACL